MLVRVNRFIVLRDAADWINQERLPLGYGHAQHSRLDPVHVGCLAAGVGQQWKRQVMMFRKCLVRTHVVKADAENLCVQLFELEDIVAKFTGFGGAAGRFVFRVEIQHYPLVPVVLKRMQLPGLVRQFKFRRWRAHPDVIADSIAAGTTEDCKERKM